ncbi:MAG: hypothetical protein K0R51_1045 [Cytophagaceae bacterium]|jgi:hypothetical protein|nr:hypothetical protein [Cytophagaceae bacterium]
MTLFHGSKILVEDFTTHSKDRAFAIPAFIYTI